MTLSREIFEEVNITIKSGTKIFFKEFQGTADATHDTHAKIQTYFANYTGEFKWISYEEKNICSNVAQLILEDLFKIGKFKKSFDFKWVIFDADNTLFDFNTVTGLTQMIMIFFKK